MKPREKEQQAQAEALDRAANTVPFIGGQDTEQALQDAVLTLRHLDPEAHQALGLLAYAVGPHLDEHTQHDDDAWLLAAHQVLTLTIILLTALAHDLASMAPEPESKVVLH